MAQHLVDSTLHTSHFYMLPKILKPNNPGCPIVSACCCSAENIEAYLDEAIAPLVGCLLTYIKDTNDALRIFDTLFDASNENPHFLFTMDIKSLYTVIPNNGGLQALSQFFNRWANKEPPTYTLTRLAELVLTLTAFFVQWRILSSDWWHGHGEQDGSQLCLFIHGLYWRANFRALYWPLGGHRQGKEKREHPKSPGERQLKLN